MHLRTDKAITVLNIFSCGSVGGIEKLFYSIGNVSEYRQVFVILSGAGSVSDAMAAKGMDVRDLTVTHRRGILSNLFRLALQTRWIRKICVEEEVDVVATHHGSMDVYLLGSMLRLVMQGRGRPAFVRHVHSVYEEPTFRDRRDLIGLGTRIPRCLIAVGIRLSDSVIAISDASMRSYADAFSIPRSKQNVVYNCVDDEFFDQPQKSIPDPHAVRIVFIGRLEKGKGVANLLEAIGRLRYEDGLCCTLEIVGDGSQRVHLEELVTALDLSDQVAFLGTQQDVITFLQRGDIFVQPALSEEGFGLSLVEAMAMGLICVVTPSGGMKEIIADGVNGFMSADKSSEALGIAIRSAFGSFSNGLCHEMSVNARKTASLFRRGETVRGYFAVYTRKA